MSESTEVENTTVDPVPVLKRHRKIFVAKLGADTSKQDLEEYFTRYGAIEDVNLKREYGQSGRPKFAFIVFQSLDSFESALAEKEHIIGDVKVLVSKAIEPTGQIIVQGLEDSISEEQIKTFFAQFGKIVNFKVIIDRHLKKRKHYCFVTFESRKDLARVLETHQYTIGDVVVQVRKARPQQLYVVIPQGRRGSIKVPVPRTNRERFRCNTLYREQLANLHSQWQSWFPF